MTTKMAEVTLAVRFREKDELGNWRGGTMYILDKAAGQKWLAWLFALFGFLASFGIGCAVQANSTAEGFNLGFGIPNIYTGVAVAVLTALVIIGGLKRIYEVTTYLVPFMAIFYIVGAILVVATHTEQIVPAFSNAVKYAFSDPMAMPGAIAGWAVKAAITRGIARGVSPTRPVSRSAPMVLATAVVTNLSARACTASSKCHRHQRHLQPLPLLQSLPAVADGKSELSGAKLSLSAFEVVLGGTGTMIHSVGLALIAFYHQPRPGTGTARPAATYIFGTKVIPVLKILWNCLHRPRARQAACSSGHGKAFLDNLWDMADTLNGLMAIPNTRGPFSSLSGELRKLVKDFDEKAPERHPEDLTKKTAGWKRGGISVPFFSGMEGDPHAPRHANGSQSCERASQFSGHTAPCGAGAGDFRSH